MLLGVTEMRFDVTNLIVTGTVSAGEVSRMMLGGFVMGRDLEEMYLEQVDDITFEDIAPILENLYDVEVDGACAALSAGFTGTATRVTAP